MNEQYLDLWSLAADSGQMDLHVCTQNVYVVCSHYLEHT